MCCWFFSVDRCDPKIFRMLCVGGFFAHHSKRTKHVNNMSIIMFMGCIFVRFHFTTFCSERRSERAWPVLFPFLCAENVLKVAFEF